MEEYLANEYMGDKQRIKRIKVELQHARDSSILLPMTDSIFRIQTTDPESGKRRQKTPREFGETLKPLLGRRNHRSTIEYNTFQMTLK